MSLRKINIVISGGGTGGHIFPAIAIADRLKENLPGSNILFIGAKGKMEMKRVPEAGYPIRGLWISGMSRKISAGMLLFPLKLTFSLFKAWVIIRKFKPVVAVGVGGFASGPAMRAAHWNGVPVLIQEQNSYPGITNRLLAKEAERICVAYEGMDKYFPAEKIVLTGNPIRKEVIRVSGKRVAAAGFFDLDPEKKTVLVIGGSQGALSINHAVSECLHTIQETGAQLIWQTGSSYAATARKQAGKMTRDSIRVVDFIRQMDLAYALADIVISRAGAISIAELALVGKPVIFIPFPAAAEDHQMKNAMKLAENEAALVIRDQDAINSLPEKLKELLSDGVRQEKLSRNIGLFAMQDADKKIADEIINLIKTKDDRTG